MSAIFRSWVVTVLFLFLINSAVKAQSKGDPPTVKELGSVILSRNRIITRVVESDSSMKFTDKGKIDGLPYFVGVDSNGSSVQLIGNENDIKRAKYIFAFSTDKKVNVIQYQRMAYFASTVGGSDCLNWFYNESAKFVKDPFQAFTSSEKFKLNAEIVYEPKNKALILLLSPGR